MIKPITPKQVVEAKARVFPEKVIEAFNEAIALHWNGSSSTFTVEDVCALIREKMRITTGQIEKNHYLDVEPLYREVGWSVRFDSSGYCETGPSTFTFRKK